MKYSSIFLFCNRLVVFYIKLQVKFLLKQDKISIILFLLSLITKLIQHMHLYLWVT